MLARVSVLFGLGSDAAFDQADIWNRAACDCDEACFMGFDRRSICTRASDLQPLLANGCIGHQVGGRAGEQGEAELTIGAELAVWDEAVRQIQASNGRLPRHN